MDVVLSLLLMQSDCMRAYIKETRQSNEDLLSKQTRKRTRYSLKVLFVRRKLSVFRLAFHTLALQTCLDFVACQERQLKDKPKTILNFSISEEMSGLAAKHRRQLEIIVVFCRIESKTCYCL